MAQRKSPNFCFAKSSFTSVPQAPNLMAGSWGLVDLINPLPQEPKITVSAAIFNSLSSALY
jgi:hypothetical protein